MKGNFIIQQKEVMKINVYLWTVSSPSNVKQILMDLMKAMDFNAVMVGKLSILLTSVDRSKTQEHNKESTVLTPTIEQRDLKNNHKTFYSTDTECF